MRKNWFALATSAANKIVLPIAILGLASLCGCANTNALVADHSYRTVSFPRVELAEGERIESVEVIVVCARFAAINRIPNDWSAEVVSPVSAVSTFRASAGHGSSSLWRASDLDGFITVMNCEPSCFSIKAKLVAFTVDGQRTISFTQSDLVIKPLRQN